MQIAVYGRPVSGGSEDTIANLFNFLIKEGKEFIVYKPFADYLMSKKILKYAPDRVFASNEEILGKADIMVSLGGDGTFLESVSIVQDYDIPIVGINTGRLGFLADIPSDSIESSMSSIFNNQFFIMHSTVFVS